MRFKSLKLKKSIEKNRPSLIVAAVVLIIVGAVAITYFILTSSPVPTMIITGLSTIGYEQVSVDAAVISGQGVVALTSDCYRIVAYVEDYQAESIIRGIEGTFAERPNAHDIATDAFESLGIELLMVKITDMRNSTYYGKMIVKSGNNFATLDARPSDATAIAVRMNVPIYVKEDLLKTYGENVC